MVCYYFAMYLNLFHFVSFMFSQLCKIIRVFLFFNLHFVSKYLYGAKNNKFLSVLGNNNTMSRTYICSGHLLILFSCSWVLCSFSWPCPNPLDQYHLTFMLWPEFSCWLMEKEDCILQGPALSGSQIMNQTLKKEKSNRGEEGQNC